MGFKGEAFFIKDEALKFINPNMNGLDIGSGGVPIFKQSVSIDINPSHYDDLVQLKGDAADLYWFKDNVMDYVFSSHCFEDFVIEDKVAVFGEWLRVIKSGGLLLLYLPDERTYRACADAAGVAGNLGHKDPDFSIQTVREIASNYDVVEIYSIEHHKDYSFFIVFRSG